MVPREHNITDKMQWTHVGVLLDRGNGKVFPSACSALARFSSDLCRYTENYSYMLHSSNSSSLHSCNTEQAYSIKRHVCAQKLAASTTRKAYTIDPNWQCLSARRRGFPRTKTTANAVCRICFVISARVRNVIVHTCSVDATRIWPELK